MRIAIVHDYIKEYGGAERVLEELIKIYPDAHIYTSVYIPEYLGPHRDRFKKYKIRTSFLQNIPFKAKLISPMRLAAPLAFMNMDLSRYDRIIVSQTGAYFPSLVPKSKDQRLICYTHTPPRYLYGYMTARDWKSNTFKRVIGNIMNHFLRMVDFYASKNVDVFIANSEEVAKRIKKFYRREATVIYPPVSISDQRSATSDKQSFYLTGGRLAMAKGTDIIIDAFIKNGKPLKVFGKGFAGFEEKLKTKAHGKPNIEFLGEVSDDEKLRLMAGSIAFVFSSFDEDFGITPVEAMGTGTPVIAFKSGGVTETVVEGKTGLFYEANTPFALNKAINSFEKLKIRPEDCRQQAKKFSPKEFDMKIKKIVEENYNSEFRIQD